MDERKWNVSLWAETLHPSLGFGAKKTIRLVSEVKTPNISLKKPHPTLFYYIFLFPVMKECSSIP